jgi:AcrR family transcriptional regulator
VSRDGAGSSAAQVVSTRLSRAERASRTRRELLGAAERRFVRDGYHATTLEAIAADAGYSKGAVYSAFDGKADLFLALADAIIDRRLRDIATLFELRPPGPAWLKTLALRRVEESADRWVLTSMEFWLYAAGDRDLVAQFASRHRRLRRGLAALASAQTPLGADSWAITTIALSSGLALERLIDADGVPEDLMTRAQRLLYAGKLT